MPSGNPVAGSNFFPGRFKQRRRRRQGETREDFDAVECLSFFFPLIPRRPVHVWGWGHDGTDGHAFSSRRTSVYSFRAMPIRWSPDLLGRVLLRYWLWLPLLVGLFFSLSNRHGTLVPLVGFSVFLVSLVAWVAVIWFNGGQRDIRRLLGRHGLGVSDPATWTPDLVALIAPPGEWFGTATFADAVDPLLDAGRFSAAMWAARLCLAVESEPQGQELTRQVLRHPGARAALARIGARPESFKDVAGQQHAQPFPLLRRDETRASAFWQAQLTDKTRATYTFRSYAGHAGGIWAYSNDTNDRIRETKRIGPRPPADQRGGPYRLGGVGLIAALVLGTLGFIAAANLAHEKPAADKAIEELQRQRAAPPAPVEKPLPPPPRKLWPAGEPGNWQYLADLPEAEVKDGIWKFRKDGRVGDGEQSPIAVGDRHSPKGLSLHPNVQDYAAVKYKLGGQATRFRAAGGINDTAPLPAGPLYLEVWGDGQRLWRSDKLAARAQFHDCTLDIGGVDLLELRAVAPELHFGLHAVWLEPRVLMK